MTTGRKLLYIVLTLGLGYCTVADLAGSQEIVIIVLILVLLTIPPAQTPTS